MYLKSLKIKNFRSIKNTTINFNKGINILIGPNNSGKTTIIDALYYCFNYKNYNSKHVCLNDFRINNDSNKKYNNIEFHLIFEIENDIEKAIFLDLYDPKKNNLNLYFKFYYNEKLERIQSDCFGGANKDNPIHYEIFDYILNIYLSALRDAERYLTSGKPNIISKLLSKTILNKDKKHLMNEINKEIKESKLSEVINDFNQKNIQNNLNNMIFKEDNINLFMSPIEQDFDKFTQYWNIKIILSEINNNYLDLSQNGLGYNNLIYISVLLSYLNVLKNKNNEDSYISLSIEEPEAHLHPQLQTLFLLYLNKLNENNNIQIFITSHSPTLTSKAKLNSLIPIQSNNNDIILSNLGEIFKNKEDITFLKKFLDVTKSQLLFSNKIIFVEGITEVILVPLFADIYEFNLDKNGVEIVNMNGIAFKHFLPLFDEENDLNYKGAILTDKDQKGNINKKCSDNYNNLKKYENKNLKIKGSNKTFEYDLIISNNFDSRIWDVYREEHPKIFNIDKNEKELFKLFDENHNINKSKCAINLFNVLKNNNENIIIPKYIEDCFKFLKGEIND